MRDRLIIYAVAGSIGFHVVLLVMVGKTSAAKPIQLDQLKIVRVDLMKSDKDSGLAQNKSEQQEQAKPKANDSAEEAPYVPPVKAMVTQERAKQLIKQGIVPANWTKAAPHQKSIASHRLPGNPGSGLSGISAPNGTDMGDPGEGSTPTGWVPGEGSSSGTGSGSGEGIGTPEPVHADPGPATVPAVITPRIDVPAPAPQPRMIDVTVCSVSGILPGQHCKRKESKNFREGSQPSGSCNVCKAPEPEFVSRVADRSEPELTKDYQPRIPSIDEAGEYVVKVRYTVDTDGSVSDIEIVDSSDVAAIDRAIKDAVSKLRYKPAIQDGQPRSVKVNRRYRINL